jgi:hypothetical protein
MVLHVAALAGFFLSSETVNPAIPEPEWKWWLKLLAEVVGPLISTAGSIYVAWRVFRWQGKKDRDQWARDQRVTEWKSLVELTAEFEQIMPEGEPGKATVDGVRYKMLPLCDRISHLVSQLLFVAPTIAAHRIQSELSQIKLDTDRAIGRIEIFDQSSQDDKTILGTPMTNAIAIRERIRGLHSKVLSLAHKDLFGS